MARHPGSFHSVSFSTHIEDLSSFFDGHSPVAQMVTNLPAMQETRVESLGRGDPWEKGMSTHSRLLAWRIP